MAVILCLIYVCVHGPAMVTVSTYIHSLVFMLAYAGACYSQHTCKCTHTHSPWDIKECLFPQCVFARVPFPKYATKWIDMRKLFASFYQMRSGNLSRMLESVGLHFEGREHCGLDDARNIARVVEQLIKDGCVLKYNRFIPDDVLSSFGFSGGGRSRKKR